MPVARELRARGHAIVFEGAGALSVQRGDALRPWRCATSDQLRFKRADGSWGVQKVGPYRILRGAGALPNSTAVKQRCGTAEWRADGFAFGLSDAVIKQYGPPTLAIVWFNYLNDGHTHVNPLVAQILHDPAVPCAVTRELYRPPSVPQMHACCVHAQTLALTYPASAAL